MFKFKITILCLSVFVIAGTPIHDNLESRVKGQSFGGLLPDNVAINDGIDSMILQNHNG